MFIHELFTKSFFNILIDGPSTYHDKRNKTEKNKCYMISLLCGNLKKALLVKTEEKVMVTRDGLVIRQVV